MNENPKDKNGILLQEGTPVRIMQTEADYRLNRVYHIKKINDQLFLTLPLKELAIGPPYFAVESVR